LSGINEGTLSKLKHGKASPTVYTLERVAKALNTELVISFKKLNH